MDAVSRLRSALSVGNKTSVRSDRLVDRLCSKTGLHRNEVINGLRELRDTGEVCCKDWHRGEPIGRVELLIQQVRSPCEEVWIGVMHDMGVDPADQEVLIALSDKVEGLAVDDMKRLLSGLLTLRKDLPQLNGQSRYLVSAKYLLGSSKLLDALPSPLLRKFGINLDPLIGPPSYIITAGPSSPACVVLVENPQAMEAALQTQIGSKIAWIATFGYGLSRSGNEYGGQLASLIEGGNRLTALVRQGTPPPIEHLLQHSEIYFWGDFDREGFQIYWRLRSKISQLRLSGLYHPMRAMIESTDNHHAYNDLVSKPNQNTWQCSDMNVQKLLDLCESRAVDQESVSFADIEKYAALPYSH
ncbi:Wadjet anti-phage system protein JetD domain-containing protein [Agaribacterium haliotis]|uniref:Wadjet anti-phage system protein JetD domain-containing protein n=1 Tax=Agaribacterium haliotis TaxID=2013869 RepID=UPI000BB5427F|nr:Wadjet anti-phage system protein JetD domain-containing protein [Agaribacterium haliotis]